jgi:hypothetical protein
MNTRVVIGVVVGLGAALMMCCLGTVALGVFTADDDVPPVAVGTGGLGFFIAPPAEFTADGPGHWGASIQDGRNRLWLDVQQLSPIEGTDDVDAKLTALWSRILSNGYDDPKPPLIQRRFVANGARSHFARATVRRTGNPDPVMVSLFLVEADAQLVPLFFVQGCDTNEPGALMIITYSFPKTHALVEALLAGVNGSPVGRPLLDDMELVGDWSFADTGTLQWAHQTTGATAVTP